MVNNSGVIYFLGGIASARRAREFDVSVGLIEGSRLGGTCVCCTGPYRDTISLLGQCWLCS
jgi:hypothetical protein